MAKPKITVHRRAVVAIMRSEEMLAEVARRAEMIAAAANAEYRGTGDGYVAHSNVHSTRARGAVVATTNQAKYAEAKHGLLTKSIDAGRD